MGNIYLQSLDEIWKGDAYTQLRMENLQGEFNRCIACKTCQTRFIKKVKSMQGGVDIGSYQMFIFEKDEDK